MLFFYVISLMLTIYFLLGTREQDLSIYRGLNIEKIEYVRINTRIIPIYACAQVVLFRSSLSEKDIEKELVKSVRKLGGEAIKLNSSSLTGLPDRLVLLPHGLVAFIELKAPGKKPRKLQSLVHERLGALGFKVYVVDSKEMIQEVLNEIHIS